MSENGVECTSEPEVAFTVMVYVADCVRDTGMVARLLRHLAGGGDLVDDTLNEHNVGVNVGCDRGHELRDEVVDGRRGQIDPVALGIGREMGLLAGHVEVGEGHVNHGTEDLGVVERAPAVVGPLPEDMVDAMESTARDAHVGPAVVVRVRVGNGRNKESAEELAGHILSKGDAHVAAPAGKARAVGGVGVGGHGDAGHAGDR